METGYGDRADHLAHSAPIHSFFRQFSSPLVHSPLSSLSLISLPPPLLPPLCSVRSGPSLYIFAWYQPGRRRQRSSDNRVCLMASLNHWNPARRQTLDRVFLKFFHLFIPEKMVIFRSLEFLNFYLRKIIYGRIAFPDRSPCWLNSLAINLNPRF